MMAAVRGKDTKPEMLVRRAAHRLGLRFRLHGKDLPGRPDLVFPKWKTVVFVNGCFWHRHEGCRLATIPKSNVRFWKNKFAENVSRDAKNYLRLKQLGWRVIVLWQCEIKNSETATVMLNSYFKEAAPIGLEIPRK